MIVGFYFAVMLATQDWPLLIGPYEEWGQCASVREYLDRRGYETSTCAPMPMGQDALYLNVIDIP